MSTIWTPAALLLAAALAAAPAHEPIRAPEPDWPPVTAPPAPALKEAGASFLLERTEVRALVTGPVARVVVAQRWRNPNSEPVDGLYLFPLPENAAVTDLSLRLGERWIRAEMRRREEARALYEQARRRGQVAALLDQERPNVFAQQVANIMPGVEIDVVITFDQEVGCDNGGCEYVFPTVVGPRFIPARQADPGRIAPPVIEPGSDPGQRLSLAVEIDAGVDLHDLASPSHRVRVTELGAGRARAVLAGAEAARLDRDFRLRWRVGGEAPEIGLLAWRAPAAAGGALPGGELLPGGDPLLEGDPLPGGGIAPGDFVPGNLAPTQAAGVFTLIVQPPSDPDEAQIEAREIIFVLDCSGSMRGEPLEAAKNVVRRALGRLRPQDTFQVIQFSMSASALGPRPLPANTSQIQRALRYLDSLQGEGGTEMIQGIRAALDYPAERERVRIVAFLTDGYIGNESEILAEVRRKIGGARLFSFGIGSSVNRYLLESLAEEGRGVAAFLAPRETPDEMAERFVRRIDAPVLTDIRIRWQDLEVEDLEPGRLSDLFAGQPLLLHGRYRRPGAGIVEVSGTQGGVRRLFRQAVRLPERAADHEALGRLWARARIHRLERELHGGQRPDIQEAITSLGLRHRLMTAWTSLVAIDSAVVNSTGRSTSIEVPVEMPQNVSYEGVFGADAAAKLATAQVARVAPAPQAAPPAGSPGEEWQGVHQESPIAPEHRIAPQERARADERSRGDAVAAFDRLTLARETGALIVIEADGEVWKIERRSRLLARSLSAAQMDEVRRALAAAHPGSWRGPAWGGSPCASRLEIEASGRRAAVCLPSGDPGAEALAALIERLGA
jgi:Ca-activated chloride channel family protein